VRQGILVNSGVWTIMKEGIWRKRISEFSGLSLPDIDSYNNVQKEGN